MVRGARLTFDTTLVSLLLCWAAGCLNDPEDLPRARRRSPDVTRTPETDAVDASDGASDAVDGAATEAGSGPDAASSDDSTTSTWKPRPRWILAGEIENARDLGGVPIGDSAEVRPDRLFRGPPLAPLTAAGCEEFRKLGIRTVIDLRIAEEREVKPEAPCVQDSATIVTAPLPVPYNVSPSDYVADLDAAKSMATLFDRLGDADSYPIYFHCTWGRDRTGVVTAVVLSALGVSRADILKEYVLSGPSVGAYPNSLEAVLDVIAQRGGIDAHLKRLGVASERVATLQQQAAGPRD
jgi:protein-tyrosine phosphatase